MTSGAEFKKLHELLGPDFRLSNNEAQSLHEKAETLSIEGKFFEALELLNQALQIVERTSGEKNRDVLNILATMATTYIALGDFDHAAPLLERSFSLAQTTSTIEQPVGARVLYYLAAIRLVRGKLPEAEVILNRASLVVEKFYGREHFAYALVLQGRGLLDKLKGDYPKALVSLERGSALMEKVLGSNDPRFAQSLNVVASIHLDQADYEKAESTSKRSVEIFETVLGFDHFFLAQSLDTLSLIYQSQGRHRQALPILTRSLVVVQKTMGADSLFAANTLNNLGMLHWSLGNYSEALASHQKSLAIYQRIFGDVHFSVAKSLSNIGVVLQAKGNPDEALPFIQRSLAIMEKSFGPEHILVATLLNNLAVIYQGKRNYAEAAKLLQRSLEINEKALGGGHPTVAMVLDNLAAVYRDDGQIKKAVPLFGRSREIREKALGTGHPEYAKSLENFGEIYQLAGDLESALGCFQRSHAIMEAALGAEHPSAYNAQRKLAWAQFYHGDLEYSVSSLTYSFILERRYLFSRFASFTEPDAFRAQEGFSLKADAFQSLCSICVTNKIPKTQMAGAMQVIVTKASLEEFQAVRTALEADPQTATQVLREQHQSLQFQITCLAESKLKPVERDARRRELQEELTRIELQLAQRVGLVAQSIQERKLTLTDITRSLPPQSVLVDFIQFRQFDFTAKTNSWKEQRYAAYLTFPLALDATNFHVERVDLGEAAPINEAVAELHQLIADKRIAPQRIDPVLQRLSELVYAPLARHLTNVSHLIVCPDGQLSRLPFEMLRHGSKFLVEEKTISYVTSGREVARLAIPLTRPAATLSPSDGERAGRGAVGKSLVMGNPDFDLDLGSVRVPRAVVGASPTTSSRKLPAQQAATKSEGTKVSGEAPDTAREARALPMSRALSRSFTGIKFAPLTGSEEEAKRVAKLLGGDCVLRLGKEARESELKAVVSPRVLHLATHGFFLSDQEFKRTNGIGDNLLAANTFGAGGGFAARRSLAPPEMEWENPMVRCGIALAGANHTGTITNALAEDGLLTGLEASLLNLQGTELVILSACDSGNGELKIGEGVMSLRRAFRIAGAETVLASHWKVSDKATSQLMTEFMRRWRNGEPRGQAWREAQLSLLHSKDYSNPYFWAAFTLTGQWR